MKKVFAVAAHPDDIEFVMSGTMLRLKEVGYQLHYMTIANGCCGSQTIKAAELAQIRRNEAMQAASLMEAHFHESLCNDLEIFYDRETLTQLASLMRQVSPDIVLTHALQDYMEDHMNTARLAVTAAFSMGMPNFPVSPPRESVQQPVAVYHAQPFMNRDPIGNTVCPQLAVDVGSLADAKKELLACHASQKEWLDVSQGMDAYLDTLSELDRQVGRWTKHFQRAEGWTQHATTGLSESNWDPLSDALGPEVVERIDD